MNPTATIPDGFLLSDLDQNDMRWFLGQRTWIRANAAQTGGAIGMIQHDLDPGFASPYHVHHAEDEEFFVLSGAIRFFSGEQSWVLEEGGFAFLPREVPHGFRVEGEGRVSVLLMTTPGGFEGFVSELSTPEPPTGPPDMGEVMACAARYNVDILGPLPEQLDE